MNKLNSHFHMGAHIQCHDGQCGKLAKVAIDKDFMEVTHLIVEEGFLLKRARVFPISAIERMKENEIYVNLTTDELANYPEYQELLREVPITDPIVRPEPVVPEPVVNEITLAGAQPDLGVHTARPVNRIGVPHDLVVIGNRTIIRNMENPIGWLDCVIIDKDSLQLKAVVVRQGLIFTDYATLPIEWVEAIDNDDIILKYSNRELHELISTVASMEEDLVETAEHENPLQNK